MGNFLVGAGLAKHFASLGGFIKYIFTERIVRSPEGLSALSWLGKLTVRGESVTWHETATTAFGIMHFTEADSLKGEKNQIANFIAASKKTGASQPKDAPEPNH